MNGGDWFCESLLEQGVDCVFGLPGTQDVALYEAFRRGRIRSVVATHELSASFMANGYYRASGRLAALSTIPGPGFTFALPGLAEARHDSAALLHLVGQPPPGARPFQFQALEQRRIAETVVKGIVSADETAEIGDATARAVALALSGEPGPVLLDYSDRALEGDAPRRASERPPVPPPDAVGGDGFEAIVSALVAARRPLVMAGQGAAGAPGPLLALAEQLNAPVFTTLSGRGVLPEDHPLALGFEFVRGDLQALNALIEEADCVLAVGCKLTAAGTDGFRLRLPSDRLLHVDASAEVVGATYAARAVLVARAEEFLDAAAVRLRARRPPGAPTWGEGEIATWRTRLRAPGGAHGPEPEFPELESSAASDFLGALREALPRDAIVVTDSGTHQTLVRRHFEVRAPRGLIVPSDFQSMGFGLPAAIGARLAAPDRPVVAVIGDGGFAMMGLELLTAVRERIGVTLVVFNDGRLNRIRLQQLARYGHASGCDVLNPDFEGLAMALGVDYLRAGAGLESALRAATARPTPTLVEVVLGDSMAIQMDRAKGLARGLVRRALGPSTLARIKRRVSRQGS